MRTAEPASSAKLLGSGGQQETWNPHNKHPYQEKLDNGKDKDPKEENAKKQQNDTGGTIL